MKKKRINLLLRKRDYHQVELFFHILRLSVYGIGLFLVVVIIIVFWVSQKQSKQLSSLMKEQRNIQLAIKKKQDVKERLLLLSVKNSQLKKFMGNDVNFLPYYKLLRETISHSTTAAILDNVVVDKDKNVNFDVLFPDYNSFIDFFSFAESDDFLSKFQRLSLNSFVADEESVNKYDLSFSGVFKNLNGKF